jgi:signal transduction histidine kinase
MSRSPTDRLPPPLRALRVDSGLHTQLLISLVFTLLFASFVFSLAHYWHGTLEPRLHLTAETQARILAQSQAAGLAKAIEHSDRGRLGQRLDDLLQEMLIVEDPAIGERIVVGVALQFDYEAIAATPGSLDRREGNTHCERCFHASVPLIDRAGDLLGVAEFNLSDGYFRALSHEMQSKLIAESSVALVLLGAVWIVMLVMFRRLHAAKLASEASDRAKTRFMANVSHELRTPLNAILGYTQLFQQDPSLMAQHGQGILSIDRSADHLLLMINDILDFSRADEQGLGLRPQEVGLIGFLDTLVEMTEVGARLKAIRMEHQFSAELPAFVRVDEKRLRQVLLNLLSNAVKFTETGGVMLSVTTTHAPARNRAKLRFSVRDTGIGIAKEHLGDVFIAFHQLDNTITSAEGSGLGLTISQRLVESMGSRLMVDSTVGVGSHFWFDLDLPCVEPGLATGQPQDAAVPPPERPITMPPRETIDRLIEHAQRHNILGARALLKELRDDAAHAGFVDHVEPYVRNYRFRQLADWLKGQTPKL